VPNYEQSALQSLFVSFTKTRASIGIANHLALVCSSEPCFNIYNQFSSLQQNTYFLTAYNFLRHNFAMANSMAGTPFGTAVGVVLFGFANLFAQHPQAAAIGYSLYTLTEIAPYVLPNYNTTAAKIRSFTSYPLVSDLDSASSNTFQDSFSELLGETSTVPVTESSVIPPIPTSTTPDDIASDDSLTNSTSAESEPTTVTTETIALESEVQDASDERIESTASEHHMLTISSGTSVESEPATSTAAETVPESEVPAFSDERIDTEAPVDTEVLVETEEQIAIEEHFYTEAPIGTQTPVYTEEQIATREHTDNEEQVESDEHVDDVLPDSLHGVPTTSTAAATEATQVTVEEAHDREDFPDSSDTHIIDDAVVNTTIKSTDTGYILTAFSWLVNKISVTPEFGPTTANTHTASDSSSPSSINVPLPSDNAHVPQGTTVHETNPSSVGLVQWFNAIVWSSNIPLLLTLAGLYGWSIQSHVNRWHYFTLGAFLLIVASLANYASWEQFSSSIRKCFPVVLIAQLCILTWFWIGRGRCMGFVRRTIGATKDTVAAGWQTAEDFSNKKRPELMVVSIAVLGVTIAKHGPDVFTTLRPYFTVEILRWVSSQIKSMAKSTVAWCVEGFNSIISMATCMFAWCSKHLDSVIFMAKYAFALCSEQCHLIKSAVRNAFASYIEHWYSVVSWASIWAKRCMSEYLDYWISASIHLGRLLRSYKDAAIAATQSAATILGAWAMEYVPPFVPMTCRPRGVWLHQGDMSILFSATFVSFFLFCRQRTYFASTLIALFWALCFGLSGVCTDRFRDFFFTVVGASFLSSIFLVDWKKSWKVLKASKTSAITRITHIWYRFRQALRTGWQHCLTVWRSCRRVSRALKDFVQHYIPVLWRTCFTAIRNVRDFVSPRILAEGGIGQGWLINKRTYVSRTCQGYWRSFMRRFGVAIGIPPESNTSIWAHSMGKLGKALGVEPYPVDNPAEEPEQRPAQEPEREPAQETEKKPARETEPEPFRETERKPTRAPRRASFADKDLSEIESSPTSSHKDRLPKPVPPKDYKEEPIPLTEDAIREKEELDKRREEIRVGYQKEAEARAKREEENKEENRKAREEKEQEDRKVAAHKSYQELAEKVRKEASVVLQACDLEEEMEFERARAAADRVEHEERVVEKKQEAAEAAEKLAASLELGSQMGLKTAAPEGRTTFGRQSTDLNEDDFPLPGLYNRKKLRSATDRCQL
jgi:hypothetical protein